MAHLGASFLRKRTEYGFGECSHRVSRRTHRLPQKSVSSLFRSSTHKQYSALPIFFANMGGGGGQNWWHATVGLVLKVEVLGMLASLESRTSPPSTSNDDAKHDHHEICELTRLRRSSIHWSIDLCWHLPHVS